MDPMELEIGYGLIPLVDVKQGAICWTNHNDPASVGNRDGIIIPR